MQEGALWEGVPPIQKGGTVGDSPLPHPFRSMVLVEPCTQTGTMASTVGWIRVVEAQRGAYDEGRGGPASWPVQSQTAFLRPVG